MTPKELLASYLEMEKNRVFCCSADYHMNTAKAGYEREFREAQERVMLLEELLEDIK